MKTPLEVNPSSGSMQFIFETYLIDVFNIKKGALAIHETNEGIEYINPNVQYFWINFTT